MDKFDKRMKAAREDYAPSSGFVDRTMDEVRKHKIHRRFSLKVWGPTAAGVFAVLVIAIVLAPKPVHNNVVDNTKSQSGTHKAEKEKTTKSPTPISDGTDDASLERDLGSIAGSMSRSDSEQSEAESALKDNEQQISIPTS